MIKNLMLYGGIGPVEFYVFVAGANVSNSYFYEEDLSSIRFFSKGNELTISPDGVRYKGIGGSFCPYMFGVEKPFKDLIRKEVLNRLVVFGAFLDRGERLIFTNDISGSESFQRLFLFGHAVKNYYFFISSDERAEPRKRQRQILSCLGKFLKRTDMTTDDRDMELLDGLVKELNEPRSTVFVFKLVHRENREFYEAFEGSYSRQRRLTLQDEALLDGIAKRYNIDSYQQERMKIDGMYRHPENRGIVDEYRDILLDIARKDTIQQSELARLHRLRTLSIRNNIPGILFDTLDDLLLKNRDIQTVEEAEYLKESRAILENLFFKDPSLKRHIINEDIAKLVRAKHLAHLKGDKGFERILLDTGRACDEFARLNNDFTIFEEFSSIITYFDRYDNVYAALSRIAFVEEMGLTEDLLRSLIGNKREFDALDANLFGDIFIKDLLANKYITSFGKKKIRALSEGIEGVIEGDASLKDVIRNLLRIADEERIYKYIRTALKERMREFYTPADMKEGIGKVCEEIRDELIERGIAGEVPDRLFRRVLLDLKTESYYLNNILPMIIQKGDMDLREDFLENSGLDRFYVEDLEREYLIDRGLDSVSVQSIREVRGLPDIGGGERIRTAA